MQRCQLDSWTQNSRSQERAYSWRYKFKNYQYIGAFETTRLDKPIQEKGKSRKEKNDIVETIVTLSLKAWAMLKEPKKKKKR